MHTLVSSKLIKSQEKVKFYIRIIVHILDRGIVINIKEKAYLHHN